jgi:phospholipid transport system substrate-binding protein
MEFDMLGTTMLRMCFRNHLKPSWNATMPTLISRRRLGCLALLCLVASPPVQAADPAVTAPIRRLYDALLAVMKAGMTVPFERRYDQLAPTVDAVFDLTTILQNSIGPLWHELSPDLHAELLAEFRRYTIASYISSFNAYNGQRFEISPDTRVLPNDEQVVTTHIIPVSDTPHRLDYVMRPGNGAWQAIDVLAEGTISRVAVQRSDFRHLVMEGGGMALLSSLQRKSADLAKT